ncbi:MAG TPA: DUF342 domain-containing protein [Peptococcaceae bacterium]|nr:DUF342 domain-containing protein [Peptococcaceae bacterium]
MKEIIATGSSLESIRKQYAKQWSCSPEELNLDVIEKPSLLKRYWKVKVVLPEKEGGPAADDGEATEEYTKVSWDGNKYLIKPGRRVKSIVPYPLAGKLMLDDQEIKAEQRLQPGTVLEFYPEVKQKEFTWNLEVAADGSKAVAEVKRERPGRYVLAEEIPPSSRIVLEKFVTWQHSSNPGETLSEEELKRELAQRGIVYGIKPNIWIDFLTIDGEGEVLIAEYTPPLEPLQPEIIDYVGEPIFKEDEEQDKIDFFACKLRICQKDEVLARKVPGREGKPGMDIFGKIIPVPKMQDFEFKLKKNVYLSEDGLEVRAACAGTPLRVNKYTYQVENAYIVNQNVDLTTGSINFPGDVKIGRNVTEGFYVHSGGKIHVQGSVSGASLKAEAGLKVNNSIIASKIIVGEKHVFRSQLFKGLKEVREDLSLCLAQVEQLQNAPGNFNAGQLLKIILERNFKTLPQKAKDLQNLLNNKDPDCVTPELEGAVMNIGQFLVGMGPLQPQSFEHLKRALKAVDCFLADKEEFMPVNVVCDTNYVQNSEIDCAGDFFCKKGIYNSTLKIEGNIKIAGVCRGGEISCAGDIYIWELGGSNVSSTIVRAGKGSRITIEYCHSNVRIFHGKELIRIDSAAQKVEIYRDKGLLQVEKLRWDGRN